MRLRDFSKWDLALVLLTASAIAVAAGSEVIHWIAGRFGRPRGPCTTSPQH
jgi:hypothetical protein